MQIVVDTIIDTLRVNKSRINMIFARKLNHLSKVYQFYCLGVIWAVLPYGTCYFSHRWCGRVNHSRLQLVDEDLYIITLYRLLGLLLIYNLNYKSS